MKLFKEAENRSFFFLQKLITFVVILRANSILLRTFFAELKWQFKDPPGAKISVHIMLPNLTSNLPQIPGKIGHL